jgi:serine/threonine-protein kinase
MTVRCPACGTRYADGARFCTRDGSRLLPVEPPAPPAPDTLPGQLLDGRYRVRARVAEGGMAIVYAADDVRTGEALALKVLAPVLTGDETAMTRLRREAELGGLLRHPNVCPILAMSSAPGDVVFVVMPFLPGETLAQRLQRVGVLPPAQVAAIVQDAAAGLHAAHLQGVVHRDLKPENVMLCPVVGGGERAVVMDFGLATSRQARMASRRLTRTGMVMGTPEFMSPEQLRDEPLDARSDVYALALVACELLTGRLPFAGETQYEQMLARLEAQPLPLGALRAELRLPAEVESVMRRGLAAEREQRFPTAPAFAAAFAAAVHGTAAPARA